MQQQCNYHLRIRDTTNKLLQCYGIQKKKLDVVSVTIRRTSSIAPLAKVQTSAVLQCETTSLQAPTLTFMPPLYIQSAKQRRQSVVAFLLCVWKGWPNILPPLPSQSTTSSFAILSRVLFCFPTHGIVHNKECCSFLVLFFYY